MLSPIELVELAESFTSRIPSTSDYDEERNRAWLAVGTVWLHLDAIAHAASAVKRIDDPATEATLRIEAARWTKAHPDSEIGRSLLQETVSRISILEQHLSRKDVWELVPNVLALFGRRSIDSLSAHLSDPFSAANVHVEASFHVSGEASKREQLGIAEAFATSVPGGNRDFALRAVFSGYRHAGLLDDAERIRLLANIDPESLTKREDAVLGQAHDVLRKFEDIAPKPPADTQSDRLRRFVGYRMNDLKVIFLTDACRAGGISQLEIEDVIRSTSFQAIEPPRPCFLSHDTSQLDEGAMARFLFQRPISQNDADRDLLYGERGDDPNPEIFIKKITTLFRNFAHLAQAYTMAQVDQGLWFVLGHPFWLRNMMDDEQVEPLLVEQCLKSMIHPFRDYLAPLDDRFDETIFFMWWDILLDSGDDSNRAKFEPVVLNVLGEILRLPSKACQSAALHGLNHLHPNSEASRVVRQYLEEHRGTLTNEEVDWVEKCAAGSAM